METENQAPTVDVAVEKVPQKVVYPPYWAKRKKNLKKEFIQRLQESANSDVIATDEYGEYRLGTFLHKAAIVTVARDNGLWSLHIMSQEFVSSILVEEIRYKYLPDDLLMANSMAPGARQPSSKAWCSMRSPKIPRRNDLYRY